ncbi:MAG: hypothetical protein Ct9H90mP13_13710 [Pseudomonadota bacterium]|nr:MAG: hypothetical protein Ct9H90mP13_13710 [Pseudomonadota bacterium]
MIIENEYDFVGSLTFSWPKRSDQATLNYDDEIYDPSSQSVMVSLTKMILN